MIYTNATTLSNRRLFIRRQGNEIAARLARFLRERRSTGGKRRPKHRVRVMDGMKRLGAAHRVDGVRGQIEPLLAAFAERRKTDPIDDARFVASHLEHGFGRCAVEEVDAAAPAAALQAEAAHAMSGDARQVVV